VSFTGTPTPTSGNTTLRVRLRWLFIGIGHTVTEQFLMGDIGYVPMRAGHYVRNTGNEILRLLIGFNNGTIIPTTSIYG
jgi:hypothetical protein